MADFKLKMSTSEVEYVVPVLKVLIITAIFTAANNLAIMLILAYALRNVLVYTVNDDSKNPRISVSYLK